MPLPFLVRPCLALTLMAAAAGPALAQSMDRASQRAWVQLGAMHARVDSLIRADFVGDPALGLPAVGTTLNFEDDLGLARTHTVPNVVLGLRLSERWRVEFENYRLSRRATQTLFDEDIIINGVTYSASAQLDSRFDSRVQRLTLGYSLLKSATEEAGVALGVQYTRYQLIFVGEGRINNEPPETTTEEESDRGPLPTIGVYGSVALGGNWSAAARVDYLPVSSRRVNGYLGGAEANVYWRLAQNFTLGLGYRSVAYKINRVATGDVGGRFEYRFRGPQVLLEAGF